MSEEWNYFEDEYGKYKKRINKFGLMEVFTIERKQKWHDENPPVELEPQPPTLEEQLAEKDRQIAALHLRDATIQGDLNFIFEVLGG